MTLILKQIYAFIKLLNSDTDTNPLAAGLSLGFLVGFAPFISLQTLLFFIIVFIFRVQIGAAFLSAFFFKFIAYLFDSPADMLGRAALEFPPLKPLYVMLYNLPIVPMTRFNNSIVMGSMIISFLLFIPSFFIFKKLIAQYRSTVVDRFKNTKLWKAFVATKIYNWYATYKSLY